MSALHHQIVIVGGGTAGITVAAQLLRKDKALDIAIVEPSDKHYYQPAWTLVAAGTYNIQDTVRPEADYLPAGVTWLKDRVTGLNPVENNLTLSDGSTVGYKYLVLCPGIQIDWHKIKGLKEAVGKNSVCCNYDFNLAPYTWEALKNFKGGTALFTNPNTPIKCGGAPQKIMYLAADYMRKNNLLGKSDIHFTTAGGVIFGVKVFAETLNKVIERYGIKTDFHLNLKEIRPDAQEAVYDVLENGQPVGEKVMHYDFIHVTPPMSAPDFIKQSPLANAAGWIDVDKFTLQSTGFPNVFGLGDAAGTPNAKTGAAIRKQAPVVVHNLYGLIKNGTLTDAHSYNGYGSCPLITGYGKMVLAEFDYNNNPTPSFPFINQAKEHYSMWLMKKYALPFMYWNFMLKGMA
ncbi:NAD(P)/FAD-dependent oxidoreductase [Sphingobacteriales bacterium UPWRP_1]|nr:pyridine nucleotide-disulfide oxidoreductase [Sphingobacteriales bacterium TSM_CSM]PSJ73485.1 NAD(P)/FAD-dependent oxidoreductase [Sphingobacteriales bacterium UPWRP_1]